MKQRIRQSILARRRAMSPSEAEQKSRTICDRLLALPEYRSAEVLHCYVSSKDNEVDTCELIKRALSQRKRVVVPVTDFVARVLHHIEIAGIDDLHPTCFGLMEPHVDPAREVEVSKLHLVLVPGIAFDHLGHRIGFGGGFYDRFLAGATAPKIGLAYEFQVMQRLPSAAHDIAMDRIVTEVRVYDMQPGCPLSPGMVGRVHRNSNWEISAMRLAERLDRIPPYLFMELRKKIAAAKAAGVDVINLAVGDPVEPTPASVVEELRVQAGDPANHPYPPDEEKGMLKFREAVARWYEDRYGVRLDPKTEVLGLIGSKEGVHHFALARINPGDVALMTDPGYPAYRASILIAGGEPYSVPMLPEHEYLPVLEDIPSDVAQRASAMLLNYPNNPTGALASPRFFANVVEFARTYDIAVCHDNPYSEILFDGAQRLSFLSIPGARDVGIELNSLSKPYNMTGWRIGMALGNKTLVAGLSKVKENTDSGIFAPVQYAAVKALQTEDANVAKMLGIYARRRALVVETFRSLGWQYDPPKGTFYLWIPTRAGARSDDFAAMLLEEASVVVAPGAGYGQYGEGYIRISVTVPDDRLHEAMDRIKRALS